MGVFDQINMPMQVPETAMQTEVGDSGTGGPPVNDLAARADKAAMLKSHNVADADRARLLRISADELQTLEESPEFAEAWAKRTEESVQQAELQSRGWDAVEEEALGTVLGHLRAVKDGDYALKAAMLANKAQRRRGPDGHRPTIAGQTGALPVVIHLNPTYVNGLQQNFNITEREMRGAIQQKRVNVLPAKMVTDLFKPDLSGLNAEEALFAAG